jgi:methylphosphotriester-DNA--protein-cysteine methyltransferase
VVTVVVSEADAFHSSRARPGSMAYGATPETWAPSPAGYPAETTFSTTFKRIMGQPPGRYRRTVKLDRANGAVRRQA